MGENGMQNGTSWEQLKSHRLGNGSKGTGLGIFGVSPTG